MDTNHNYYLAAELPIRASIETDTYSDIKFDGTQAFTIEAWIKINSLGANSCIVGKKDVMTFGVTGENIYFEICGCPITISNPKEGKLDYLDWHYLTVSYDKQRLQLYIDGVCVANSSSSDYGTENGNPLKIGENLNGKIRRVLIYNRGISANEVMNNLFNEPVTRGLVSNFDFTQNPPLDTLKPSRQIALKDNARIVQVHPSAILAGTAFMAPSKVSNINPGGAQVDTYTVQAFVRVNKLQGIQTIFANSVPDSDTGMALYVEYDSAAKGMRVKSLRGTDFNDSDLLTSKNCIQANEWVNIATVYDGEKLSIYINGEKDTSAAFGPIINYSIESNPMIGGRQQSGNNVGYNTFQGNISSLEVWNIALSDTKIKEYATTSPKYDEVGLTGCFDFTVSPIKNEVDDAPISLCDGAVIRDAVAPAPSKSSERKTLYCKAATYSIAPTLLQSIRETVNFEAKKNEQRELFRTISDKEAEELKYELGCMDLPIEAGVLQNAWDKFIESGTFDIVITNHVIDGEVLLIVHKPTYSYVAYKAPCHAIDSCILLRIELLFLLLAGILTALFGLNPTLNDNAINFINNRILPIPEIATRLSAGTTMTATGVFSIGAILVRRGLLKDLLKMVLSVGFWFFVRLIAKLVLTFLGIGAAATIASLIATAALFAIKYTNFLISCFPFPPISIDYIKFNHNLSQNTTSAMNIRKNLATTIRIPEWTTTYSEPVAYIRNQALAGMQIQVKFTISSILPYTTQIRATAVGGNLLGNIPPFNCSFFFGSSTVMLMLTNNTIGITPVGVYTITLFWEYLNPDTGNWAAIQNTNHRIYVTLDTPVAPWGQAHNLIATWPWADALDKACTWATGAAANNTVPENITAALYASGATYVGALHYTRGLHPIQFDCTAFLNDISRLGIAAVNLECSDCAAIVGAFSRMLGVTVSELSIMNSSAAGARLNCTFIRPIGLNAWSNNQFIYHIIAFTQVGANMTNTDAVYDPCLAVNGDLVNPWPIAAPAAGAVNFIPGSPAHAMQISTTPINAPVVNVLPYAVTNSYTDRLLLNTIIEKTLAINAFYTYTIQ